MKTLDQELFSRLEHLKAQQLYRQLRRVDSPQSPHLQVGGRSLLNFSSNDYLGLANDPAIKAAAADAVQQHGAGAGASRLISGSLAPYHELEEVLASFKNTEAALTFSTGFAAALGTIGAVLDKKDIIIIDKLSHACIVDAARLSGARLRVFDHNDLADLEVILQWAVCNADARPASDRKPGVLIVTESVFSMDGDHAPLAEIVELKEKYGAWLMIDEAHATGLYGPCRRGLAEELGVSEQIEIQMGTLGKALGSSGGYICGSRTLVDFLINRARTFIFSTAPVPAAAAAALAAIEFVRSPAGDRRRNLVWQHTRQLTEALGFEPVKQRSVILPLIIGDEASALAAAAALQQQDLFIPAIRYPTVPRGRARLRLTLSAAHTSQDVASAAAAIRALPASLQPKFLKETRP